MSAHLGGMKTLKKQIEEIKEYAAATGKTPESVCRKLTNNPVYFASMQKYADKNSDFWTEFQEFKKKHPAPVDGGGK